ncbi:MAG: hypothetical protein ACOZNI_06515 [Myxococcota bacterium]
MKKDPYKELGGEHLAADEDADRAVPAGTPVADTPYVPDIPGFSPGISHGDDTGDMGGRSGVFASADAGDPLAPESEGAHEPPAPPIGLGAGEGDRGLANKGGLFAGAREPRKARVRPPPRYDGPDRRVRQQWAERFEGEGDRRIHPYVYADDASG